MFASMIVLGLARRCLVSRAYAYAETENLLLWCF
jgi:hypothetical protein